MLEVAQNLTEAAGSQDERRTTVHMSRMENVIETAGVSGSSQCLDPRRGDLDEERSHQSKGLSTAIDVDKPGDGFRAERSIGSRDEPDGCHATAPLRRWIATFTRATRSRGVNGFTT